MMIRIRLLFFCHEGLILKLKILFFSIRIFPAKKKKTLTYQKARKKMKKEKKQPVKKQKAPQKEKKENVWKHMLKNEYKESGILDTLSLISSLLKALFLKTKKYVRIRVKKFHIQVASEDAAKTALLYGAVSQATAYITEILRNTVHYRESNFTSILVESDFLSEKTKTDIEIEVNLRVWHILAIFLSVLKTYFSKNSAKNILPASSLSRTSKNAPSSTNN